MAELPPDAPETAGLYDAMRAILADNKWHPFHEFVKLAANISPEYASQRYIMRANKHKRAKLIKTKSLDEQINRGRRWIIGQRLNHLASQGEIEARGRGFEREYRLLPKDGQEKMEKTEKPKEESGVVSISLLHHIQCCDCKKWWSVGGRGIEAREWFCPWCGRKQQVRLVNSPKR